MAEYMYIPGEQILMSVSFVGETGCLAVDSEVQGHGLCFVVSYIPLATSFAQGELVQPRYICK